MANSNGKHREYVGLRPDPLTSPSVVRVDHEVVVRACEVRLH